MFEKTVHLDNTTSMQEKAKKPMFFKDSSRLKFEDKKLQKAELFSKLEKSNNFSNPISLFFEGC